MSFWIALGAQLIVSLNAAEAQFEADHLASGYSIVMETEDGTLIDIVGPFALI